MNMGGKNLVKDVGNSGDLLKRENLLNTPLIDPQHFQKTMNTQGCDNIENDPFLLIQMIGKTLQKTSYQSFFQSQSKRDCMTKSEDSKGVKNKTTLLRRKPENGNY